MNRPIVSVLIPVYNAEKYLCEAVDSILTQTLSDFELIILNDGSSDASHSILSEYEAKDARIVYKNFTQNRGLPSVLNDGIKTARGKYIARMDQDDISLPTRLQEQVSWMEAHPEVDICGAWVELIGSAQSGGWQHPVDHASIHARMLFSNAIAHPTVMMRADSMRNKALRYDEKRIYIEDYELWSRALEKMQFANLDKILLRYRIHSQNTGVKYRTEQIVGHEPIYRRLLDPLQMQYTTQELALHQKIANMQYEASLSFLYHSYLWLAKISRANRKVQMIPLSIMDAELNSHWLQIYRYVLPQPVSGGSLAYGIFQPLHKKIIKFAHTLLYLVAPGVNSK